MRQMLNFSKLLFLGYFSNKLCRTRCLDKWGFYKNQYVGEENTNSL